MWNFKDNKNNNRQQSNYSSLDREKLEHLLSLQDDPRWKQLSDILLARLKRKEDRLSQKPLYDEKEVAHFNMLIGEIREIKNFLDLDRLIRETLTHNDE
tara:strand:- start:229 stop:525 length:297 start_codon:yes stop_codon:yes gene_type:complete